MAASGLPAKSNTDKTKSYEVGLKGDFLDHKLSIDASLYYVDWKNIQLELTGPPPHFYGYITNGSAAKSEGVELSVTSRPLTGMTINGWVTYDDAELTQTFPAGGGLYGVPGNRLPNSSRFSGYLSLQQDFLLWDEVTAFVGGTLSYVGDRMSLFESTPQRQILPAYTKVDLRLGVLYDTWTVNVYVNNVTDARGIHDIEDLFPYEYVYIQPRTLGLDVSKTF